MPQDPATTGTRPAMYFADQRSGTPFAKDPAVVRHRGRYLLYYSRRPPEPPAQTPPTQTPPDPNPSDPAQADPPGSGPTSSGPTPMGPTGAGTTGARLGIGIAESRDLDRWTVVGELEPEPGHAHERRGLGAPGAVVLDGRVHLFYQSYGNGPRDAICHAVSEDGLSFVRHPGNPVFSPTGDWNNGRAIDADVVVHGDRLLMAVASRDPAGEVQLLATASAPLGSRFGRRDWTQISSRPALVPELDWEQDCVEAPAMCRRDGRLFMFYAGAYNNAPQQIGCAVSDDDGATWTRLSERPWLPVGPPGSWNSSESGHPFLFTDEDGSTHLFFQGNDDDGASWYLSRVPVHWQDGLPVPGPVPVR